MGCSINVLKNNFLLKIGNTLYKLNNQKENSEFMEQWMIGVMSTTVSEEIKKRFNELKEHDNKGPSKDFLDKKLDKVVS